MKIALVDDHVLFRKGMESMLEDIQGIEVVFHAGNGQELLEKLAYQPVDLILLDLEMPVMDGLTVLPLIREQGPEIKILIISMHQEDEFVAGVMERGANGYLLKDAEYEELEIALQSVQRNGFYFNDQISKAMLGRLVQKQQIIPSFAASEPLTEREVEVLELICRECTTAEIADRLCLSPRTIEGYRNRLLDKTGARNTAGLVVFAARQGWLNTWLI
ncbi:MAG: response regulator transcription factor [Bacteroidota bacterium]